MVDWCMAHPWMTFWLGVIALLVIDSAITNLFRFCNNCLRVICAKNGIEVSNKVEEEN